MKSEKIKKIKKQVAGKFLGGITRPKPFIYLDELKTICRSVSRTHNFTDFDEAHNEAVWLVMDEARKISKARNKK
jgi:hypothetical protein